MSEDLIIKHCSPTLAGIKTANLFNCPYSSRLECECDVRKLNKMFCKKGIKVLPLKFSNGKALIYIFRPSKLAVDLSDEYACKLLESADKLCNIVKAFPLLNFSGRTFIPFLQNILFSFLTSHSHSSRDEYGQLKRLAVFIPASVGEQCLIIKSSDIFSSK